MEVSVARGGQLVARFPEDGPPRFYGARGARVRRALAAAAPPGALERARPAAAWLADLRAVGLTPAGGHAEGLRVAVSPRAAPPG